MIYLQYTHQSKIRKNCFRFPLTEMITYYIHTPMLHNDARVHNTFWREIQKGLKYTDVLKIR